MSYGEDLRSDIEADVGETLLADLGFDATYKRQGAASGETVRVYVSNKVHEADESELGDRFRGSRTSHKRTNVPVLVAAMRRSDTVNAAGVGTTNGGVATLEEGDILADVPGDKVGRPEVATLSLAIVGGIVRVANGGHWNAEARP